MSQPTLHVPHPPAGWVLVSGPDLAIVAQLSPADERMPHLRAAVASGRFDDALMVLGRLGGPPSCAAARVQGSGVRVVVAYEGHAEALVGGRPREIRPVPGQGWADVVLEEVVGVSLLAGPARPELPVEPPQPASAPDPQPGDLPTASPGYAAAPAAYAPPSPPPPPSSPPPPPSSPPPQPPGDAAAPPAPGMPASAPTTHGSHWGAPLDRPRFGAVTPTLPPVDPDASAPAAAPTGGVAPPAPSSGVIDHVPWETSGPPRPAAPPRPVTPVPPPPMPIGGWVPDGPPIPIGRPVTPYAAPLPPPRADDDPPPAGAVPPGPAAHVAEPVGPAEPTEDAEPTEAPDGAAPEDAAPGEAEDAAPGEAEDVAPQSDPAAQPQRVGASGAGAEPVEPASPPVGDTDVRTDAHTDSHTEPGQPALYDDPDAFDLTVDRSALLAGAPGATPMSVSVLAVLCPAGHVTPPHASTCRQCGREVPPQEPFSTPRPALGVLRLSTGDVVILDRGVLLGRAPQVDADQPGSRRPHVVKVASPLRDVSRNHLEVILDGWHVLVRDLATTNGTTVTLPGRHPVRLLAHDQQVIEPGTVVSLADEVTLTFELGE